MKASKKAAPSAIEKFKTPEELSAAYAALEREFTKRCQLVKELQAKLDSSALQSACDDCSDDEHNAGKALLDRNGADGQYADISHETAASPIVSSEGGSVDVEEEAVEKTAADPAKTEKEGENAAVVMPLPVVSAVPPVAVVASADADDMQSVDIVGIVADRADELKDALSLIPEVMEACIARYKRRLMEVGAYSTLRGEAVVAPVKRPRTLSDAKRLADEMLR